MVCTELLLPNGKRCCHSLNRRKVALNAADVLICAEIAAHKPEDGTALFSLILDKFVYFVNFGKKVKRIICHFLFFDNLLNFTKLEKRLIINL